MLAIGQGSKRSIQSQIAEMGSNMIMINPGADMRGGVRQDPSAMQTLKLADSMLAGQTKYLSAVSPTVNSSGGLFYGANNYPGSVSGVNTEYLSIRQLSVENGEMFTDADIQSSSKVCVIGKTIADNLFPMEVIRWDVSFVSTKFLFALWGAQKPKVTTPWGGSGCRCIGSVHHRNETFVGGYLSARYLYLSSFGRYDRSGYRRNYRTLRSNHKLKDGDDDDFKFVRNKS